MAAVQLIKSPDKIPIWNIWHVESHCCFISSGVKRAHNTLAWIQNTFYIYAYSISIVGSKVESFNFTWFLFFATARKIHWEWLTCTTWCYRRGQQFLIKILQSQKMASIRFTFAHFKYYFLHTQTSIRGLYMNCFNWNVKDLPLRGTEGHKIWMLKANWLLMIGDSWVETHCLCVHSIYIVKPRDNCKYYLEQVFPIR